MARTIDNLGLDISTRYAQDKEQVDQSLLKDSRILPVRTQIDVTAPSYQSEFDLLFQLGRRNATWADFFAPIGFFEQHRRLFLQQIIPSLGSQDQNEAQVERVAAFGKVARKQEEGEEEKEKEPHWEEELKEEERERKILLKMLHNLQMLDQYLIDINSRRSQYQKG